MPQFSDEQVLGYLRNFLTNYRNQCPDPKEFCQSFRKDRRKIYPEQHYLIEQVLAENGLQFPEDAVEKIVPEIHCNNDDSEGKNETLAPTPTVESPPAEIPPKPKIKAPRTWTQQYGKRQATKEARKELILVYLNEPENVTAAFTSPQLVPLFNDSIKERMVRYYMEELFQAKKVKRWVKSMMRPDGTMTHHHLYTGSRNRNPYFKWVDEE